MFSRIAREMVPGGVRLPQPLGDVPHEEADVDHRRTPGVVPGGSA